MFLWFYRLVSLYSLFLLSICVFLPGHLPSVLFKIWKQIFNKGNTNKKGFLESNNNKCKLVYFWNSINLSGHFDFKLFLLILHFISHQIKIWKVLAKLIFWLYELNSLNFYSLIKNILISNYFVNILSLPLFSVADFT